ncbi:MAG: tRNA lysidine(34) synthetase TilS [Candidatus Caldatribacteriota bacterium]|nr:tRNA lysidine(34) synthetase TilS [Candidatus Caldatribacteriota bacterium]
MLEEKVLQTIKKFDMLSFNDRVLIGISGGPDSVTLLNILLSFKKRYNLSFFIAHLDHMLRGKESDEDVSFVKNLAQELGLPCEVKSCNLTKIARKEHLTIEEAAREYRYKFYLETAKKFKANKIALGHNADDQVETVLMRFLRGSGLEGLMGIPPVRGKIIRPLIECSREEIEGYCKENKIGYRVDSSNKEVVYFRNKIRLELLPLLAKDYNKNIKDITLRLRNIVSEVSAYLNQETELLFKEVARRENPETVIIDLRKFTSLPPALKRRIIRKAIEVVKGNLYSISFRHNNEILKLTEYQLGEKEIYLPDNLIAKKIYNKIIIYKKRISKDQTEEKPPLWEYNISIPGKTEIQSLGIKIEIIILDSVDIKSSLYFTRKKSKVEFLEFIDYNKVNPPLKLRNRRSGDKFYPLKMKGLKKVKDFFIDNKIPKSHRDLIPILVDNEDQIIWIMGMRLDDRVKINSNTKKVLCIKTKIKNAFLQEYF